MNIRAWPIVALSAAAALVMGVSARPAPAAADGKAIFQDRCASCHEQGERAPAVAILRSMPAERIHRAMTTGLMKTMATGMSDADKLAVADYLGGAGAGAATAPIVACPADDRGFDAKAPILSNGFGISGPGNTRAAPLGGLTPAIAARLAPIWSVDLRKPTFPLIAGGSTFTTTLDGEVIAVSAATGCLRWRFATGGSIRSGLILDPAGTAKPRLYFGDRKGTIYALDAASGALAWKTAGAHENAFANVLATPVLHAGRLYVSFASNEGDTGPNADPKVSCCTFRGLLAAFDAKTGAVIWRHYTIDEKAGPIRVNAAGVQQFGPSGAAVLNTPTIDAKRGLIYGTADNNYSDPRDGSSNAVFALELATGRQVWHRKMTPGNPHNAACYVQATNCPMVYDEANRSDWGFKASPVLAPTPAGEVLIAPQKSGQIWGLDPATGQIRWEARITSHKVNYGVLQGVAVEGGVFYATVGEFLTKPANGPYPGSEELGLYKLDAATGKVIWTGRAQDDCPIRTCAGYWDAPVVSGGLVTALSTDQFLRIYDAATGRLVRRLDLDLDGGARVPTSGGGPSVAAGVIYAGTDRKLVAVGAR